MKTKKQFTLPVNLKLFMVLPIVAILLVAFSSCGKTNKTQDALTELVPPPPPPADQLFKEVDEMPQFNGGDAALLKYIAENTTYPEEAKKNGIAGKVIVKLVVEKDGSVSNVGLGKSANSLLDAEAVRVVSTLPRFEKPGKKAGETVRVQYMIPISFTLK